MKATLEFDTIEDREELSAALNGMDYLSRLRAIDNRIRDLIKHQSPSDETEDFAEDIRAMLGGDIWE